VSRLLSPIRGPVISVPQKQPPPAPLPAVLNPGSLWVGNDELEARAAYKRAREAGLTTTRAMVVGVIGSFRFDGRHDGWIYRRKIAEKLGCSIRTVQRAINDAIRCGLMKVYPNKPGEMPIGAKKKPQNRWSHRFIIGFGKAAEAAWQMVCAARARLLLSPPKRRLTADVPTVADKVSLSAPLPPPKAKTWVQSRKWTDAELDAELARRAAGGDPNTPPE